MTEPIDTAALYERNIEEFKRVIRDLTRQLEKERKSTKVTPEEIAEFTRLRQEHQTALTEQNKLALWLRSNRAKEIARGDHKTMGGLANVIIYYLKQGRRK